MAINYAKMFNRRATPQSQPIPGSSQVRNSGGGYSWEVDDWTRLDRFLILGAEGGTYCIAKREVKRKVRGEDFAHPPARRSRGAENLRPGPRRQGGTEMVAGFGDRGCTGRSVLCEDQQRGT